MNYDFELAFKSENPFPRDWKRDMDEVYDFINILGYSLEKYKESFASYTSANIFSEEEVELACKNILYISKLMAAFPFGAIDLSNEVYSTFRPLTSKKAGFSAKIPAYIDFLNRFIAITKPLLSEYGVLRDEYFDRELSILSKRQMLNSEEIHREWQDEKHKLIESGENIRWAVSFRNFFRSVFKKHKEEIDKNKQTEEYNQLTDEAIADLMDETNAKLNK